MYTLITAATSSEAYILKGKLNIDEVLLGDYLELPELMVKAGKMIKLPNPTEPSYVHQVLALCLDKSIDTIYPIRPEEQELLLNSKQLFSEYGINICLDDTVR